MSSPSKVKGGAKQSSSSFSKTDANQGSSTSVSEQIDDVFVRYMSAVQRYRQLRSESSRLMKQGYWAIADTRHQLNNPAAIASTDYSGRDIRCTLAVETTVSEKDKGDVPRFHAIQLDESSADSKSSNTGLAAGGVVRRRVFGSNMQERKRRDSSDSENEKTGDDQVEDAANSGKDKNDAAPDADLSARPLQWFGVLTPQTLRTAQSHFRSALDLLLDLANAAVEMQALEKQFYALSSQKKP